MTKLRVVSPPSFLADLFEGPIGKTLNCIQLPPGERYDHCISFVQHTRSPKRGLFLSLQNRKGRHNHGMWWETFWGAASTIGHAWGDTQDDEKAFEGPFEEWAREEVASLLSGRIRSRLTELLESIRPNLTEEQKKEWLDACRELQEASKHPDLEGYSWSEALECTGLLLEASRGAWSPSRLPSLKHAVSEMSGTLIQNKGFFPLFLKRAGISTLLPSSLRATLLAPFVERVEDEHLELRRIRFVGFHLLALLRIPEGHLLPSPVKRESRLGVRAGESFDEVHGQHVDRDGSGDESESTFRVGGLGESPTAGALRNARRYGREGTRRSAQAARVVVAARGIIIQRFKWAASRSGGRAHLDCGGLTLHRCRGEHRCNANEPQRQRRVQQPPHLHRIHFRRGAPFDL